MLTAPPVVVAAVAILLLAYLVQSRLGEPNPMLDALALRPDTVVRGRRLWTLFTVVLVHGSWTHALLNALGLLAFGSGVARWFGRRAWGRFALFYLLCGGLSSLAYVGLHPGEATLLVGASGAISGLMGASARLIDRPGRLAGLGSRTVVAMGLAWLLINALMATRLVDMGQGAAPIAWEAHLAGFAAGLLLVRPFTPRFRKM